MRVLIRQLKFFFRRPKFRFGKIPRAAYRNGSKVKNAQFVSFLEESGFRRVNSARYEKVMHRRRFFAYVFVFTVILAFSWVMIESARALSLF
ncbi:MAG: hypothetical protein WD490_01525 [Opitutales bacterium]